MGAGLRVSSSSICWSCVKDLPKLGNEFRPNVLSVLDQDSLKLANGFGILQQRFAFVLHSYAELLAIDRDVDEILDCLAPQDRIIRQRLDITHSRRDIDANGH